MKLCSFNHEMCELIVSVWHWFTVIFSFSFVVRISDIHGSSHVYEVHKGGFYIICLESDLRIWGICG